MRNKRLSANIDNSDLVNYPNGRIKDSTGVGDGTPVNERIYGDIHEFFSKLMRQYDIPYNGLPENEQNGYQLIQALTANASKNDYILDLSLDPVDSNIMSLPIKISKLKIGESFVVKSSFNLGAEVSVKSSLEAASNNATFVGSFKSNEYVRVVNLGSSLLFIRLVDSVNLDSYNSDLGFLKAANGAEVINGVLDNKALTPESFLEAFAEYVTGLTSDTFLADATQNGLYSKEHFQIVENIGLSRVRNVGFFGPLDANDGSAPLGTTYPVNGDAVSCTVVDKFSTGDVYEIVLSNAMDNNSYFVKQFIESTGNIELDNDIRVMVFKKVSTTRFRAYIQEEGNVAQNIKIHFEVIQL